MYVHNRSLFYLKLKTESKIFYVMLKIFEVACEKGKKVVVTVQAEAV